AIWLLRGWDAQPLRQVWSGGVAHKTTKSRAVESQPQARSAAQQSTANQPPDELPGRRIDQPMLANLRQQALFLFGTTVPNRCVIRQCGGRRAADDAHTKVIHPDTPPCQLGFSCRSAGGTSAAIGQVFYAVDSRNNNHRSIFIEQGAFEHFQAGAARLFIAE